MPVQFLLMTTNRTQLAHHVGPAPIAQAGVMFAIIVQQEHINLMQNNKIVSVAKMARRQPQQHQPACSQLHLLPERLNEKSAISTQEKSNLQILMQ